jgi:hypothetical protein
MTKYAFIISLPGQSPETFAGEFQVEQSYNIVVGLDVTEMAENYIKTRVEEGFSLFNLGPGFEAETAERLQRIAGDRAKVKNTGFLPSDAAKTAAFGQTSALGIIIVEDVDEPRSMEIEAEGFKALITYVGNQKQADQAARELVSKGAAAIAMCSWFNEERTRSVVAAIDGAVPVGSCGLES